MRAGSIPVLAFVLVATSAWAGQPTYAELATTNAPQARRSAGGAIQKLDDRDRYWIFGGYKFATALNELYYFDTATKVWTQPPQSNVPGIRDRHGVGWYGKSGRLVVFGGTQSSLSNPPVFNDLHVYDPATTSWSTPTITGSRPAARADMVFEYIPHLEKFILFGGTGAPSGALPRYNDVWTLSLDVAANTATWTPLTPTGTAPPIRGASCWAWDSDRHRLIIFAGESDDGVNVGGTFQYDLDGNAWFTDSPAAPVPSDRAYCQMSWDPVSKRAVLFGGLRNETSLGDTWTYDPVAKVWTQYPSAQKPASLGNLALTTMTWSDALGAHLFFGGRPSLLSYSRRVFTLKLNRGPVANAGADQSPGEASTVTLDGSGSTDPDSDPLTYQWLQLSGPAVTLSSPTAQSPTFTSPAVTSATPLVFELVVSDGTLSSAPDQVTIHVQDSVNEPPVADAGPDQSVAANAGVTLSGASSSDPNGEALTHAWSQVSGLAVTLAAPGAVSTTFTAPSAASEQTLTFRLTVTDARGASAQDLVQVLVAPPGNSVPVANAGSDRSVGEGVTVTLNGAGSSDPDGDPLTWQWSQISGPAVTLSSSTAPNPTFTSPSVLSAQVLRFRLVVNDGKIGSTPDEVLITLQNDVNEAPTARAGMDQVLGEGALVTLDGTGSSDPNADPLAYQWTQTAGPPVTLSSNTINRPAFTTPTVTQPVALTFSLRVSDGKGGSDTDAVSITVQNDVNEAPIASAGPDQTVGENVVVTLDGTGSLEPNGSPLTRVWTQIAGPPVTLSSTSAPSPSFTSPTVFAQTQLAFQLEVTDPQGASATDEILITVQNSVNEPPIARAGPDQTRGEQVVVALNASASTDPNGDGLTYAWAQTDGPSVNLSSTSDVAPTFTSPNVTSATTLSFRVTVSDGNGGTTSDAVSVVIQDDVNELPVANAGADQTVGENVPVQLNATGSVDPNAEPLTYAWTQLLGTPVTLSSTSAGKPTFLSPRVTAPATLSFRLTVTDPRGGSHSDSVTITVNDSINEPPVVSAGPDANALGSSVVTLSATASDPNGQSMTYQWAQVSGPPVALLGASGLNATFTAPNPSVPTALTFSFTATDALGAASSDQVTVSVQPNGTVPSANAGPDQSVGPGAVVSLDGSASSDPNGDPLTWQWTQLGGAPVSLSSSTAVSPSFTAPEPLTSAQTLVFGLRVSDGTHLSSVDQVSITVQRQELPPVADAGPDLTVIAGQPFTISGAASTDPNGDPLTFTWTQTSGPTVAMADPQLPDQSITAPDVTGTTLLEFELAVHDGRSWSPPDRVQVSVTPTAALPRIVSIPRKLTAAGARYHYDADDAVDAAGDGPLTFALVSGPVGLALSSSGEVSWTPTSAGDHLVHLRATNAWGVDDQIFPVKVVEAPVITSMPATIGTARQRYRYDADGLPSAVGSGAIRWSRLAGPADLVVVGDTGEIVWTPQTGGTFEISLRAENAFGAADQSFTVVVGNPESLAILPTANPNAAVGQPWVYDEDGKVDVSLPTAFVWANSVPPGFFLDSTTRQVTWIPEAPGVYMIDLAAATGYDEVHYVFEVTVVDPPAIPPRAIATVTPPSGDAPLPVTFDGSQSTPPPGRTLLTHIWDPGDGTPPVHGSVVPRSYGAPGGYNVKLTVLDDLGGSAADQVQVLVGTGGVLPPQARLRADKVVGRDRLEVAFTCDCSDPQGRPLSYLWEFGDGDKSASRDQTHTYLEPGRYQARLTVSNEVLLTRDTVSILVTAGDHIPPEARVYASVVEGAAPLEVRFTSAARDIDGTITSRLFEFPYGQQSDRPESNFVFTEPGLWKVRFTAIDSDGLTATDEIEISVTTADGIVPPQLLSVGARKAETSKPYRYDEDGRVAARGTRPLEFGLGREELGKQVGAPEGASIDPQTGEVRWTPVKPGVYRLIVWARNAAGTDWEELTVNVVGTSGAPTVTGGCRSTGGDAFVLLGILMLGAWLRRRRGHLVGTALACALVAQTAQAAAPEILSTPSTIASSFAPWRYDPDGRAEADGKGLPLEWFLVEAPPGMFIDNLNGELFWYPEASGTYQVELGVRNPDGEDRQPFSIEVGGESPPTITPFTKQQVSVGEKFVVDMQAQGSVPVIWALDNPLPGAHVHPTFGRFSFIATQNPGPYSMTFTAANRAGATRYTWSFDVVLEPLPAPVPSLEVRPASGDAPLTVEFDAAKSVSGLEGAEALRFRFDFGDGSVTTESTQPSVLHRYAAPGTYNATVTVVNTATRTATGSAQVVVTSNGRVPPSARILADAPSGPAPHAISFRCECTSPESPIVEWHWGYGDGEYSTQEAPTHVYAQPGGYVVKLQVTDERGISTTAELPISIRDGDFIPPFARARAVPVASGDAPLEVQFVSEFGDEDGVVVQKRWFLPDGSVVTDSDPVRSFTRVGLHKARLVITDDRGLTATDTVEVLATRNGALPPTIFSTPRREAVAGQAWAYDEDGRAAARGGPGLVWELGKVVAGSRVNAPEGMTVEPETGRVSWTPRLDQLGEHTVSLAVTNAAGTDVQDFTVTVLGNESVPAPTGCGCGAGGGAPIVLAALTLLLRRRKTGTLFRPCGRATRGGR